MATRHSFCSSNEKMEQEKKKGVTGNTFAVLEVGVGRTVETSKAAVGIATFLSGRAAAIVGGALVNVLALQSRIARIAITTGEAADCIDAISMTAASSIVHRAFIDILWNANVSREVITWSTRSTFESFQFVGARSVHVASSIVGGAFIHLCFLNGPAAINQ